MDSIVQMDVTSGQLKNESKSKRFTSSRNAKESTKGTAINVFDGTIQGASNNTTGIKIYIKMYKKVHLRKH